MAYPYTVGQYNLQNYDGAGAFTHTWANWTTATAGCTVTPISQAQFQSENPNVATPIGHTGTILKAVVNNSGGGSILSCTITKALANYIDLGAIKNMVMRFYVPYSSLNSLNGFRLQCRGTGSASTDAVSSNSISGENIASRVAGFQIIDKPYAFVFCPQYNMFPVGTNQGTAAWGTFAGLENAIEEEHWKAYWGGQTRLGAGTSWNKTKLTGGLNTRIQMQAIAQPNTILTMYFFDLLKDVVSTEKPKLVPRWDDGSESQFNHLFPIVKKYGVPSVISCPMNDQATGAAGAMSAANAREMRTSGVEFILHSDGGAGGLVSEGLAAATTRLTNHIKGFDTVFGDSFDKRAKKCVVYPGNDFYNQFNEFPGDNRPDLRVKDLMYQLGLRAACGTGGNSSFWGEIVEQDPLIGGGLIVLGESDTQYANVTDVGWYGVDSAAKLQWLVEFLTETGAMGATLMGHIVNNAIPATFTNGSSTITAGADTPNVGSNIYASTDGKVVFSGSPPLPFIAGTTYYIVSYLNNTFSVSATRGGAAISAAAGGSATFVMLDGLNISTAKLDPIYAEIHAQRVSGNVIPVVFTDFAAGLGIDEIGTGSGSGSSSGLIGKMIN